MRPNEFRQIHSMKAVDAQQQNPANIERRRDLSLHAACLRDGKQANSGKEE